MWRPGGQTPGNRPPSGNEETPLAPVEIDTRQDPIVRINAFLLIMSAIFIHAFLQNSLQHKRHVLTSSLSYFNSLAPGKSECESEYVIYNLVLLIGIFRFPHDSAIRSMSQDPTDDKSTLVQVMAWCRQATSHYLSQCWLSPYGVARPQCFNGEKNVIDTLMHRKTRTKRMYKIHANWCVFCFSLCANSSV